MEKQRVLRFIVVYRQTGAGKQLWAAHRTSNRDAIEYLSAELSLLRWKEALYRWMWAEERNKARAG